MIRNAIEGAGKRLRRRKEKKPMHHGRLYCALEGLSEHKFFGNPVLYSAVFAIILLLFIEGFGYKTPLGGFLFLAHNPFAFFLNGLIIFASLSLAWLCRRRLFAFYIISFLWVVLGVVNGIILSYRMTPFTTADFAVMDLGLEMFSVYLTPVQTVLVFIAIGVCAVIFVLMFCRAPKLPPWTKGRFLKTLGSVALSFLILFGAWNIGTSTGTVALYFTNLWDAYTDYGMPYGFFSTWLRKGISKPRYYSQAIVDEIFKRGELDTMTSETRTDMDPNAMGGSFPNIVFLQLESFIDPTEARGMTFSEDPVPYFRELKARYSSGYMKAPVKGGGTANTEFEVMTGMSCREFGPGEYPYKSVLKDRACETMAYDLKALGYATHAIHNHRGAFYDRNKVFANLGFDDFTSLEYMNYVSKTQKNFARDDVLTGEILGALESTRGKDYVYAISVQGHGEYPKAPLIKDPLITVEGAASEEQMYGWEFYLEQVHEMDEFLRALTEELTDYDEDVVLVLYGDHLPALYLTDEQMKSGDTFDTEYVLWSNFDLPKEDKNLSAYQLSAEVQARIGLRQGLFTVFHQDREGTADYQKDLHLLQYDILYGKRYIYGGKNPFAPTDMKMGYRPIRVKEIVEVSGEYYISGEGFTPFSKVTLDGEVLDTTFIGPTTLKLEEKVDSGRARDMKVSQVEKYRAILSTTE